MNKIIILCGFSASGKDTIAQELSKKSYNLLVSTTSRPIRENEKNGVDYNFVTKEEFISKIKNNEFIEHRTYDTLLKNKKETWYYGTEFKYIEDDKPYIGVHELNGVKSLKNFYGDRIITFFISVPEFERLRRAELRGSFDKTEWDRRQKDDYNLFTIDMIDKLCNYNILNYKKGIEEVIKEIEKLI